MTVFNKIRQWAQDRNLIEGSTPASQMLKLTEELGELANAINKNKPFELADSIGDVVVVLTIIADMYKFDIEDCIDAAYNEIKDRKGRMVNGTFVKESDLNSLTVETLEKSAIGEDDYPAKDFDDFMMQVTGKLYYKTYTGSCEHSEEDKVWYGRILRTGNLPVEDCWTYEAKTKDQLYTEFCSAVEDYIEVTLNK